MVADGTNSRGQTLLPRGGANVPSQIEAVRTASSGIAALVCDRFDVGDIARSMEVAVSDRHCRESLLRDVRSLHERIPTEAEMLNAYSNLAGRIGCYG
jgi:predicted component of type VI protein secretion system